MIFGLKDSIFINWDWGGCRKGKFGRNSKNFVQYILSLIYLLIISMIFVSFRVRKVRGVLRYF